MSADTDKLFPLRLAQTRAEELTLAMGNACVRIEVAGAVRRLRPAVAKIELVAIPKIETLAEVPAQGPRELFGDPATLPQEVEHNFLWAQLDGFIKTYLQRGPKRREFLWPIEELGESIPVVVNTCDTLNWGLIFLRCTGSDLFVMHVNTRLRGESLVSKGARIWHGLGTPLEPISDPIAVKEEEDLFRMAKMRFVPAVDRSW